MIIIDVCMHLSAGSRARACVCRCVCACVLVRACTCVRACVRACVCVGVGGWVEEDTFILLHFNSTLNRGRDRHIPQAVYTFLISV